MSGAVQEFLARSAEKAAVDLEAALLRIPEDKRTWSPMGDARSAGDQAAECAILNGSTAELILSRAWKMDGDFSEFIRKKEELAKDTEGILTLLKENTPKVLAAIREVPDEDLGGEVQTPFGTMTLSQIMSYPLWNMSYHEGQINYIASMLGCLP